MGESKKTANMVKIQPYLTVDQKDKLEQLRAQRHATQQGMVAILIEEEHARVFGRKAKRA